MAVPACYSRSTIQRGSKPQNSPNALKTSCKLISYGSGYKKCKQPDGDEDLTTIESDDTGLTIHHGKSQDNFFHDGWWTWDEQFSFGSNLKAVYRNALLPSLIKALKNDNCDIANAILDAMQNPNIVKNGDSEFLGFKNGDDKCAVLPDGNGKGDNDGDGEGKGLDDIKPPNLQTPDLERTLRAAKKGLDDRVGSRCKLSDNSR